MSLLSAEKNRTTGALRDLTLFCLTVILVISFARDVLSAEFCRIQVQDKVEMDGADITLGKIAQIQCDNSQMVQRLKEIVIDKAPLPGNNRVVTSEYLQMRLKQNETNLAEIRLQCPPQIDITRSTVEISKEEIEKILTDFLELHVLNNNKTARVVDLQTPDGLTLPKGQITYEVVAPRSTKLIGKIPLSINFHVDSQYRKRIWTTATIEILTEVVVTTKPLGRHKPIAPEDVEIQKMDLADLPSNAITDIEAVIGKRTRNALYTKTVLRTDLVEFPPIVKRGDLVVIVAESKGLRITALGKVKKTGRLGERIPVENFDSKKILYAQVIDSRTVKVEF